jgi:iron-sulfur cluster assembly protein
MLTVTEQAKELFLSIERPEGTVLRLDPLQIDQATGKTQIGLVAGEPMAGDQVVEHEGEGLLHIARPVSEALAGATIVAVDTPEGSKIDILLPPPEAMLGPEPSVDDSSS